DLNRMSDRALVVLISERICAPKKVCANVLACRVLGCSFSLGDTWRNTFACTAHHSFRNSSRHRAYSYSTQSGKLDCKILPQPLSTLLGHNFLFALSVAGFVHLERTSVLGCFPRTAPRVRGTYCDRHCLLSPYGASDSPA